MSTSLDKHGTFSWAELMSLNVEESKLFYGQLFGWQYSTDSISGVEYTMIHAHGQSRPMAGILDRKHANVAKPEAIPPHWGCYITVNDITESVNKVKELGGNIIVPPKAIPGVGYFSVIQDLQGAVLSLMEHHTLSN